MIQWNTVQFEMTFWMMLCKVQEWQKEDNMENVKKFDLLFSFLSFFLELF